MNFVTRLATRNDINYPLPVNEGLTWTRNGSTWHCQVLIPDLPQDHIITPSLSLLRESAAYVFAIEAQGVAPVTLQQVPAETAEHRASGGSEAHISTHIDCWHTHRRLTHVLVSVRIACERQPADALLIISCRALTTHTSFNVSTRVVLPQPDPISQMEAAQAIRQRICSPTALTMCLSAIIDAPSWDEITEKCLDPLSRAYGSWPVAVRAANDHHLHGAVELISDWQTVHDILIQGVPIVCSINFGQGELTGAPLQQTAGHLVLLYGYDHQHAWVLDPAGSKKDDVPIRYDLKQFGKAWLHQRGAAYIFCPNAHPLPH